MKNKMRDATKKNPWDPYEYADPIARELLDGLNQLRNSYRLLLEKDEGEYKSELTGNKEPSALLIHNNWKLIEYRPGDNRIIKTEDNHEKMGISRELSGRYHEAVESSGHPVADPNIFLSLLKEMVQEIEAKRRK